MDRPKKKNRRVKKDKRSRRRGRFDWGEDGASKDEGIHAAFWRCVVGSVVRDDIVDSTISNRKNIAGANARRTLLTPLVAARAWSSRLIVGY